MVITAADIPKRAVTLTYQGMGRRDCALYTGPDLPGMIVRMEWPHIRRRPPATIDVEVE